MFQKDNTIMSVQTLINKERKGQVTFNNIVQRGDVWKKDLKRKSLFIHSLLDNYPVPPLYANKVNLVYDMLDGKQRSTTIINFLNNEFALSKDTPDVRLESEYLCVVANLRFNDLPEELQDRIRDFPLMVHYVENATLDDIKEIFLRLNLGKAITTMEMSRVKANCLELIQELAGHKLLRIALSADAKNRYTHEEYILKTWLAFYDTNPSFEIKDIRKSMEDVVIMPEQATEINASYDRLLDSYRLIRANGKDFKKACVIILKGIHLIGLAVIAKQSIEDDISTESFAEWIKTFLSGTDDISVNARYNKASSKGFNKGTYIKVRHMALLNHYKKYFSIYL